MVEPIDFISQLRDSDIYIRYIYKNGGCYQFYKILKLLYNDAKAFKVKIGPLDTCFSHVITLIKGRYYDITGEVKREDFCGIDEVDSKDAEEMEQWSFGKNNWLYKICPNCGEEIEA